MMSARFNNINRWNLIVTTVVLLQVAFDVSSARGQAGVILTGLGDSPTNLDVTEDASNMPNATASIGFDLNNMPIVEMPGGGGQENVTNLLNNVIGGQPVAGNAAKWLDFQGGDPARLMIPVHIQLTAPKTVKFYTLTSANDQAPRDPYEWRVLGSTLAAPATMADFTPIETRTGVEFTARDQTQLFVMTNNTAYQTYRFEFETEIVAGGPDPAVPNSIQLGEIELFENFAGGGAKLVINRNTGGVTLQNAGTAAIGITGYSIISNAGTLNSNTWLSITDNADGDNGGSLDTDNWLRLTDPNARRDLSEIENPNGTGGVSLAPSASINLGTAWIKFPTEDVSAEILLADGSVQPVSITYEGATAPYRVGDLNFDRAFTFADWVAFKSGQGFNFSTFFSAAESYAKGDMDGDLDHDLDDFGRFKVAYDAANGAGAFQAMVASVPEPNTAALFVAAIAMAACAALRRRGMLLVLLGLIFMQIGGESARAQVILPGLVGNDLTNPDNMGAPDAVFTAGGNSPGNETPAQALDNNVNTKWLSFLPNGTFYQIQFPGFGQSAVNRYTITSANDADERDPYSWTLSGSNDGATFTVVDTRSDQDFAERFQTQEFTFTNTTLYNIYKFDFQTELGAMGPNPGAPNSIQMAEIELLGPALIFPQLALEVNRATGAVRMANTGTNPISFDAYRIRSAAGALNRNNWWGGGAQGAANGGQSIHDQNIPGFPVGNGSGNGWEEGPGSTNNELVEWYLGPGGVGTSTLGPGQGITMNNIYQIGGAQDLMFDFRAGGLTLQGIVQYIGTPVGVTGDFNGNGTVDAADYVLWRNGNTLQNEGGITPGATTPEDYNTWRANFGRTPAAGGNLATSVPEPASWLLALFVSGFLLFCTRRRSAATCVVAQSEYGQSILRRNAMALSFHRRRTFGAACLTAACLLLASRATGSTLDRDYRLGDAPAENAVVGQIVGAASTPPNSTLDSAAPVDSQHLTPNGNPTYVNTQTLGRPGAAANEKGVQFTGSSSQYLSGNGLGSPAEGGNLYGRDNYASSRLMQAWVRPTMDTGGRQEVISDTAQFGIYISANDTWGHTYGSDQDDIALGDDFDTTAPVDYNQWTHVMQRTFTNTGVVLYVNGVAVSRINADYELAFGLVGDSNLYVGAGSGAGSNFFTGQIDSIKLHVAGIHTTPPPGIPINTDWGAVNLGTENDFIASRNLVAGDVNGDGMVNGDGLGNDANDDDVRFFIDHWLDERRVNNIIVGDLTSRTTMGDLNFDGRTTLADWSILRNAHAAGASLDLAALLGSSVPEPSTLLLIAISVSLCGTIRRSR